MQNKNKFRLFPWLLVLLCMTAIFLFSSQSGEASNELSGMINEYLIKFIHKFSIQKHLNFTITKEMTNLYLRKAAHITEYTILGILLAYALDHLLHSRIALFISAGCISTLFILLDEIHQYFVPGRTNRLFDVAIDSFGACMGIAFYLIFNSMMRYCRRKHELNVHK